MDSPLVSVVTPVYNGSRFITACIESVLRQSYDREEHVIVDARSTDGTVEIIRQYHAEYPNRIRFISEPDNGPGDGWNKGLKMAKGAIFTCVGYDDVCEPDAIRAVVEYFAAHPDACFLHGDCDIIDEDKRLIRTHRAGEFNYQRFVDTAKHIATPSAYYRRCVIEKIGWLDASGDDFDVMLRITRCFTVYHMDRVLSRLMVHDSTFNPSGFEARHKCYRDTYQVSRRYGGSTLSPLATRYYISLIVKAFHCEHLFPTALRVYRLCRRSRYSSRELE